MNYYLITIYFLTIFWMFSLALIEARSDHYNIYFSFLCKIDPDKHIYYSASRFFIFLLILFATKNFIFLISIIIMFPFWHNGMYFCVRNWLYLKLKYQKTPVPYKNWWFDEGSTAFWDRYFTAHVRAIAAIASAIILITQVNQ